MSLNKGLLTVLASLTAIFLITGCGQQITRTHTLANTSTFVYEPLPISLETYTHKLRPLPTPKFRPSGSLIGVTIIVDAGHGGKDPGAGKKTYSRIPEKTINLAISKELQSQLIAKGARVIMSRSDDRFIELDDRAAMAGRYNADLLVSVHADSCPDRYIRGASVYVANNCSTKSLKTARNIQSSFVNSSIKFRKIGNRDFRVLAKHSKPAVLVECGYMTNSYEANILNQNWYRRKVATAIANGIANSF